METEIKFEVIERKTITPSSPTPGHLRSLSLSVFDQQIQPEHYIPILLFYPNNSAEVINNDHQYSLATERSNILEKSLSKTLTHFYPMAGKLNNNTSISCDDHGAAFIQAQVNCTLSITFRKNDDGFLDQLLPAFTEYTQQGHLVLVQATFFECGGMAIGVKMSHKVADVNTFSTFIKSWAADALIGSSTTDHIVVPAATEFSAAASLWPPLENINSPQLVLKSPDHQEKTVMKRFVFEASKIDALKSKAASYSMLPNPTRVEVVCALIWKCAIEATRSNTSCIRPSVWHHTVNMRRVLGYPSLMGNLVGFFSVKTEEESDTNFQSLVAILRAGITKFKEQYGIGISGEAVHEYFNEFGKQLMQSNDIDNYSCTSWCRFPFYETNFGWGKPSWVTITGAGAKNIILLLDTTDGGGIEAILNFSEEDMALIETNMELLAYGSILYSSASC